MADVTLRFTADGTELKAEVASDIKALQGFANAVDLTNKTAVSAFRESAVAQREQMQMVGASAEEFRKLDAVVRTFERDAARANSAMDLTKSGAQTGGRALAGLAFSLDGATTSARGAVNALGSLAYGIAATSKEAQIAAMAGGILVLVTLLGVLADKAQAAYHALHDDLAVGKLTDAQAAHIKNLHDVTAVNEAIALADARLATAQAALTRGDTAGAEKVTNLLEYKNQLAARGFEIQHKAELEAREASEKQAKTVEQQARTAAEFQRKLGDEVAKLDARKLSASNQRDQAAEVAFTNEVADIDKLMTLDKERHDQLVALAARRRALTKQATAEEIAAIQARAQIEVDMGSGDPVRAFEARLRQIEAEKQARIKAGWDVATAEEAAAQDTAALKRSFHERELAAIGTIADTLVSSNNRALQQIGKAFQVINRVVMTFKAIENTIEGMKLTGQALGLASLGNPGAAAAFAGAAEHFAAAALAGASAAGGGGGGHGGGGGASGPRDSSRLGAGQGASGSALQRLEIVFIKQDQDGKELSRTRQRLDRLTDRNQPIRAAL